MLLVLLAALSHKISALAPSCYIPPMISRIIGGTATGVREFPFLAHLRTANSLCGGSLIAPGWVLTAAHCGEIQYVVMGKHYMADTGDACEEKINVINRFPHPAYNAGAHTNDIMLLQLATPSTYAPIRLWNGAGSVGAVGSVLTVAGWGTTAEDAGVPASVLMQVQVPVQTNTQCGAQYGTSVIVPSMLCAGLDQGGKDSCTGDSGGPLFSRDPANPTSFLQVALVSFGAGCGEAGYYGVYTRLTSFSDWICSTSGVCGGGSSAATNVVATKPPTPPPTWWVPPPTVPPTRPPTPLPTFWVPPPTAPTRPPTFPTPPPTPPTRPPTSPTPPPTWWVPPPTLPPTLPPTFPTRAPTPPTPPPTWWVAPVSPTPPPTFPPTVPPTFPPTLPPTVPPTLPPSIPPTPYSYPISTPTSPPTLPPSVLPSVSRLPVAPTLAVVPYKPGSGKGKGKGPDQSPQCRTCIFCFSLLPLCSSKPAQSPTQLSLVPLAAPTPVPTPPPTNPPTNPPSSTRNTQAQVSGLAGLFGNSNTPGQASSGLAGLFGNSAVGNLLGIQLLLGSRSALLNGDNDNDGGQSDWNPRGRNSQSLNSPSSSQQYQSPQSTGSWATDQQQQQQQQQQSDSSQQQWSSATQPAQQQWQYVPTTTQQYVPATQQQWGQQTPQQYVPASQQQWAPAPQQWAPATQQWGGGGGGGGLLSGLLG